MTTCATSFALPMIADFAVHPNERWFSSTGCVVHRGEERNVFVGGTLIGTFGAGDDGARNALLIGLMADEALRVGKIAAAFGLVPETLRLLRKLHEGNRPADRSLTPSRDPRSTWRHGEAADGIGLGGTGLGVEA